jgi:hypothetical protein
MTLSIFLIWGAHAPSRVFFGASPKSLIQPPKAEIHTESSRSRGRDRSEPDRRLYARRMRSPFQIETR